MLLSWLHLCHLPLFINPNYLCWLQHFQYFSFWMIFLLNCLSFVGVIVGLIEVLEQFSWIDSAKPFSLAWAVKVFFLSIITVIPNQIDRMTYNFIFILWDDYVALFYFFPPITTVRSFHQVLSSYHFLSLWSYFFYPFYFHLANSDQFRLWTYILAYW